MRCPAPTQEVGEEGDGDDSDFGGSGDGLSGHTIKLPLGT